MPVNLNGLIFGQIMPDNSGTPAAQQFDTDQDGAASQEDEFVSFTNTTAAPLDVSGWQVWSISAGAGAPDVAQSGLFHTFGSGTTVVAGDTLYVINEISGTPRIWAQESSKGGVESGVDDVSTNFLTEGSPGSSAEAIALVNPATGEFIIFNMAPLSDGTPNFAGLPGFPGTSLVGTIDGHSVQDDPAHGFSYQYDAATDGYSYLPAFIPCFAAGTLIETPAGAVPVETLRVGDLVLTADHGAQPVLWAGGRTVDFTPGQREDQRPIEFKPGSLGPALPRQTLVLSPQHRVMMVDAQGAEVLAPAIGLVERNLVRLKRGVKSVSYHHILLSGHEIVFANGIPAESLFPGDRAIDAMPVAPKLAILAHFPRLDALPGKACPCLSVQAARLARESVLRPARSVTNPRPVEPISAW